MEILKKKKERKKKTGLDKSLAVETRSGGLTDGHLAHHLEKWADDDTPHWEPRCRAEG